MRRGRSILVCALLASGLAGAPAAWAGPQVAGGPERGPDGGGVSRRGEAPVSATDAPSALPFAPGEVFQYSVTLGRLRLGRASLAVEAAERVEGISTYRVALEVEIRAPLLRFRDREVSWIDTDSLRSVRFERYRLEGEREERFRFRFDHAARTYDSEVWDPEMRSFRAVSEAGAHGELPPGAIDEIAALYLLRTLPLNTGVVHRIGRYYVAADNPIVFRVLGREKVRVPAGRFDTIVVEPDIPALGPFRASKGPRIYLTDDARRMIVRITTRTKVGPLTFYLETLPAES